MPYEEEITADIETYLHSIGEGGGGGGDWGGVCVKGLKCAVGVLAWK